MIDLAGGEHIELWRDRVVQPTMAPVDLPITLILVDGAAVLRDGRAVVKGVNPHAERSGQAVELLAQRHVGRVERKGRRLHRVGRRAQGADAVVQIGALETREQLQVVLDVPPAAGANAGVGLVEAGIVGVEIGYGAGLDVQAMVAPQRIGVQLRRHHRDGIAALHDVRREHVAVVVLADHQRRIEHPGACANADRLITRLLSRPHRRVLRRGHARVTGILELRQRYGSEHVLRDPWLVDLEGWPQRNLRTGAGRETDDCRGGKAPRPNFGPYGYAYQQRWTLLAHASKANPSPPARFSRTGRSQRSRSAGRSQVSRVINRGRRTSRSVGRLYTLFFPTPVLASGGNHSGSL